MASSPATIKIRHHARSISLPTKSRPLTLSVEEQLCRIGTSESTTSPSSVCHNLGTLNDLYDSVDDLLQLQLAQQVFANKQGEKCVEGILDGSLRLFDVCGATRDALTQMKKHVQDLESTLRRNRGEFDLGSEVSAYMLSKKKVNKEIRKCLGGLKKMKNKNTFFSLLEEDYDYVAMVSVLREVEAISLSMFGSLLSFISGPMAQSKPSNWSFISKFMQNKRVACEEVDADISEMEKVVAALNALMGHKSCKSIKVVYVKNALKKLEEIIQGLEDALEHMFKGLIRNRVSLLNILNH